ncbi:MAG: hypothetical protein JW807_05670 [Spirochaetes bacterium]|nr:hypothetical protein [Spirochaetota bacterium]
MNLDINAIKKKAAGLKQQGVSLFTVHVKGRAVSLYEKVRTELIEYPEKKERNRRVILLVGFIFLFDYLAYSLHTDKNIFDIFPTIPSLADEVTASVYLPGLDGETIITEKRSIPDYESDEKKARFLFEIVVKGQLYENTSMAVPADLFVRKVWIEGRGQGRTKTCIIDLEPVEVQANVPVIKNSERLFKQALEKTIIENISAVKNVVVLEKGIPDVALWEL